MGVSTKPHDIQFRFPDSKRHLKARLLVIAERNGIPLSQLMTLIIERFLRETNGDAEARL